MNLRIRLNLEAHFFRFSNQCAKGTKQTKAYHHNQLLHKKPALPDGFRMDGFSLFIHNDFKRPLQIKVHKEHPVFAVDILHDFRPHLAKGFSDLRQQGFFLIPADFKGHHCFFL